MTKEQQKALEALVSNNYALGGAWRVQAKVAAASAADVHVSTIAKWLGSPEFVRALRQRERQAAYSD
jgi:hypothetical protein